MRVQQLGGCFVVRITGEVDVLSACRMQEHLCGLAGLDYVVVHLSATHRIDPVLVRALDAAGQAAGARGRTMRIAGRHDVVADIGRHVGADSAIDCYVDLTDAVEMALSERKQRPPTSMNGHSGV
ncbi:STAS domain-containing protein [Phytoactinopolyspora alkaliphila]|uniref:STAS domain-containing protein n=1 Tax=Phytoactinopolyspora alkaliphila TaxID=1783498 RepID=A0A6N9YGK4_9ACTN|nr:STAS domain-containing protein [Phytoactinopolyspora alkaliphila]NED94038.1 STAS domain-containing protein [Phytoactinopolyspora alkaliphila]